MTRMLIQHLFKVALTQPLMRIIYDLLLWESVM